MSQRSVRGNLAAPHRTVDATPIDTAGVAVVDLPELDDRRVDEALSGMLEIDRHAQRR